MLILILMPQLMEVQEPEQVDYTLNTIMLLFIPPQLEQLLPRMSQQLAKLDIPGQDGGVHQVAVA